jgi:1-acyl-sn-glycerol-3-phosphate acyltransferase
MGAAITLVCIIATLLCWDVKYKFMQAVSRRWARASLDRQVANMAHTLISFVRCYSGLKVELDRRLTSAPPSPTIVVANHQSIADIAVVMDAFRSHRLRFVAKKELEHGFPAVSEVLRIQRHALINRLGEFRHAAAEMHRLGREIRDGVSPAVFPEGTRSRDGAVHTFHPGAVRSILSHGRAPITAVAVDGGQYFTSLADIAKGLEGVTYRAAFAGVFEHDGTKSGISSALAAAERAISDKIEGWRRQEEQA